jgi:hypothetical protein
MTFHSRLFVKDTLGSFHAHKLLQTRENSIIAKRRSLYVRFSNYLKKDSLPSAQLSKQWLIQCLIQSNRLVLKQSVKTGSPSSLNAIQSFLVSTIANSTIREHSVRI